MAAAGSPWNWSTRLTGSASLRARFNSKWLPHPRSRCWVWTASTVDGYGCIGNGAGKVEKAHRVSWELHKGSIPEGLCVLHECDNPLCVCPEHLFLGTKKDNSDDMIKKGRDRKVPCRGESNGMAKLTAADVADIRSSAEGSVALGQKYGVSYKHIWQIRKGR